MTPHLVWAFVALCALALLWWSFREAMRWSTRKEQSNYAAARINQAFADIAAVKSDGVALAERVSVVESDLRPIKERHKNGEFTKLGGSR